MTTANAESESFEVDIPDNLLGEEDLFEEGSLEEATPEGEAATTDEGSAAGDKGGQTEEGKEGEFLSDKELAALGVERGSPEEADLNKKFFPLWQDRLRRAGLTEKEIRARLDGEAKIADRVKALDDKTDKPAAKDETEAQPLVTWNEFKPKTDLSAIVSPEEGSAISNFIREHIDHTITQIQAGNARAAQAQAESAATEEFRTWAEAVKDSPDLNDAARKAILDFVEEPGARDMLLRNPKRFIKVLEAETGLSAKWREAKKPEPTPASVRRIPTAAAAVTRTRPAAAASAPTKRVDTSYEDIAREGIQELFGR